MLKIEMSPKTTTFLTDLQMRLPNIDDMQPFNGGLLKKANDNSVVDRKARVTISVSLPQYIYMMELKAKQLNLYLNSHS